MTARRASASGSSSKTLTSWCRKYLKISKVLTLLYLPGRSSGGFAPAMEQFPGSAAELSAATVTRLTEQWQDDHTASQNQAPASSDACTCGPTASIRSSMSRTPWHE